jgi:hypothetical protein
MNREVIIDRALTSVQIPCHGIHPSSLILHPFLIALPSD